MKNTSSNNMTFGDRLAYARKKKGLLQKELAALVGVSQRAIGCWETGYRSPNAVSKIQKLAKALEVPEDWLMGNNDNFSIKNITGNHQNIKLTKEQRQLVADHEWMIGFVYHKMLKLYNSPEKYEYFYGDAAIGLCKAAKAYDKYGRKVSFSTFAYSGVKWAIGVELKNTKRKYDSLKKSDLSFVSLNEQIDEDREFESAIAAPDEWESLEYRILVESVFQKVEPVLTIQEKTEFKLWLYGMNYSEIAQATGVQVRTVNNRITNAQNKCRDCFKPEELFAYGGQY